MNLWTSLSNPPQHRPGDADEKPARARRQRSSTPARRPGADLPHIPNQWGLSRCEARAQQLRVDGKSTQQIASEMGVAIKTVECYYRGARNKMGCNSIRSAVLWDRFIRYGEEPEVTP